MGLDLDQKEELSSLVWWSGANDPGSNSADVFDPAFPIPFLRRRKTSLALNAKGTGDLHVSFILGRESRSP